MTADSSDTPREQTHDFHFTGQAGEFFKIWIVNLALTLLTLGIYSAWAKVRSRRYFYGNTWLDGSSFDYLASPVTILKGRLIAFAVIVAYVLTTNVYPMSTPVFALAFLLLLPGLIVRSLRFNARNSAYRNLSFDFQGGSGEAFLCFLLLPLLAALTLGLAYPAVVARQRRFFVNNSRYGQSQFQLDARLRDYYSIYLGALLVVLAAAIWIALLIQVFAIPPLVAALLSYPAYLFAYIHIKARVTNLVINHSRLQQLRFVSTLQTGTLLWLYLSNSVAILLSLGLLIPWAMIRTARYRLDCTRLSTPQSLDHFVSAQHQQVGAAGAELGDLLGVEFGL